MSDNNNSRIRELFRKLDHNKDGRICVKELSTALKGSLPEHEKKAKEVISRSDKNSDHSMNFEEFLSYVQNQETQLKLAFKQLDRNKDDKIDAEEIRLAMADLGVNIGIAEAEKLLHKMDRDGSLTIDFNEWRDFLLFAGTADIQTIFQYWRKSSAIDIGENMTVPDDFTEDEKKSGEALKTMLAGGVAGAVSRTSTAPLDRLKVTWQAQGSGEGGMGAAFRRMLSEGGLASLWRGNGVNVMKIAPESAIKFLAYDAYKQMLTGGESEVSLLQKFTAGALAGATAQTLIYPMEVLKTRMCLRKTGQFQWPSIFDCARKVYAEGGVGLFYRGYVPNILGILPYAGIDLALFETFKTYYTTRYGDKDSSGPPVYVSLVAGAFSSVCGQVVTYPLALVRTKLQSGTIAGSSQSLPGIFTHILKTEGPAGLYRGIGPNFLKVIPAVSISYAVFDQMRSSMGIRH